MPKTSWADFGQILSFMDRMKGRGEEEDPLERAGKVASYGSTLLDIQKKQRELAGPGPSEKYQEEQRSQQVGSALEMFGSLYKTASPSSRKILGEQMTSLWGMMSKSDRTKYKMLVSHTPINPDVQKAMWFEETNPRPRMPIVREGDGTWTNVPPRSEEYRRVWAEFDIANDEWNTLKKMAVTGKSAKDVGLGDIPRQYQTDDPSITAERNPLTRAVEFTDWKEIKANHAEIQVAIDKKWATWGDIKRNKFVPLSAPREYVDSGRPVTVTQNRDLRSGEIKLDSRLAGPLEERKEAPKALTDAIALIDSGISPESLKVKSPDVVGYHSQLENIIDTSGEEREWLTRELQQSIVDKYPSEERYIPFIPEEMNTGKWFRLRRWLDKKHFIGYFIPTPSAGKKGNVVLVQADRLVDFYDTNGDGRKFWWSDLNNIALDTEGMPVEFFEGKSPGSQFNISWEELEKSLRREGD